MASEGEVSIEIKAPPEKVFEAIVDLTRHSEWNYQPYRIVKTSDGIDGVGATYHAYERMPDAGLGMKIMFNLLYRPMMLILGAKMETDAVVTALEPPRRLAWEAAAPKRKGHMMKASWEILLEPTSAGTRLTQGFAWYPQLRMVSAPPVDEVKAECRRNLERLKALVEQQ